MGHDVAQSQQFAGALQEAEHWLRRAKSMVPRREALELFNPAVQATWVAKYALARRHKHDAPSDDPAQRDPELVALVLDLARVLGRYYFRLDIEGVENVPAEGPVLLVGNHNGGFVPTDSFFTALAIRDRLGPSRAFYALAHDFIFYNLTLRRFALRLGMLRAGHDSARRAFALGGIVLVYPGSDLDTFRPGASATASCWAVGRVSSSSRSGPAFRSCLSSAQVHTSSSSSSRAGTRSRSGFTCIDGRARSCAPSCCQSPGV